MRSDQPLSLHLANIVADCVYSPSLLSVVTSAIKVLEPSQKEVKKGPYCPRRVRPMLLLTEQILQDLQLFARRPSGHNSRLHNIDSFLLAYMLAHQQFQNNRLESK